MNRAIIASSQSLSKINICYIELVNIVSTFRLSKILQRLTDVVHVWQKRVWIVIFLRYSNEKSSITVVCMYDATVC